MRFVLLSICALTLCAGAPPASIHGTVLDPSGRPVEAARIECAGQTTFSNLEGRFNLTSSAACQLNVHKDGFRIASVHAAPGEESRIALEIAGPSESVLVSATRAQATPEQAAVAANIVSGKQLEALDFPALPDVLRLLPNMSIVDSGRRGGQTSIFTRGSSSTSTLVLLDGVPLNDPGGQVNLSHISSNGIARIEAVRGPESALFGAEAASGVVQLFTNRGDPEATIPHGFVSYERGNFQTDRWLAGVSGGFRNRLDYSLAADELHTSGEFPNDFYRDNTGSANIGYRISDATQVRGIFRIYDAHVGTPGQVAYQAFDYAANEETRDSSLSARVDDSRGARYFQTFAFGYHRLRDLFNDNEPYSSQNLAALLRDEPGSFQRTYLVGLLDPNNLPAANQIPTGTRIATATAYFGPFGSVNLTERKTADYQGTLAHSAGAFVFGYNYQDQTGDVSGTQAGRGHHGFFLNEQYSLGGRLYLNGGARVEHSSAFGTEFVPRGGLGYQLFREHGIFSSTFLRLSASRGISEPSLYENYVQTEFAVGNPKLRPEKTNSYEAALVQEWLGRRVRTEVALFRSSFHDLITYVYPSWQNIESSWARGIEVSTEARLFKNVLLTGNYTRLYTRVTNSVAPVGSETGIGQTLLRRPPHSGSLVLSMAPKRWTFLIGAQMMGERHDSDYTFGINRNPGYQNVFLSASYQVAKHFAPVLRVDNLLNERYEEALGYTALSRSIIGGIRIGW